jgi:hypothetical protein
MKKIWQYALILIAVGLIGVSAYFIYQNSLGPCDKPLKYSIGRFDSQFGLGEEEFKNYATEAGQVWEKTIGRKIFVYNPKAKFKINLIYDERQLITVQKQKTESGLLKVENIFKEINAEFVAFKNQYEQKVAEHKQTLNNFENRKSAYNGRVAYWNSRGGAPENEYRSLEEEKIYLNKQAQTLNSETASINATVEQLNILLRERNTAAAEYNKVAEEYNKKYNSGLEFNQAEYMKGQTRLLSPERSNGGQVNVYQFGNKRDLVLALAHEFGHALGMGHVSNPKSIMYYLTGINAENSPTLSAEDLAELKKVCRM